MASPIQKPWWSETETEEAGRQCWTVANRLWTNKGRERRTLATDCLDLYHGRPSSVYSSGLPWLNGIDAPGYNCIRACVDTMHAHLSKTRVRPFFLTERASDELRKKAEGMRRATEQIFRDVGLYDTAGSLLTKDGLTGEAGAWKWSVDVANNRIVGARIPAWEVQVSEREAAAGDVRQMYHLTTADRASLLAFFADDEDAVAAIEDASAATADTMDPLAESESPDIADRVRICEAWHRPSGRVDLEDEDQFDLETATHDGRHLICLDKGKVLAIEAWPYDYFPIVLFRPFPRQDNAWSRPIPETLIGAQLAINRMNERIDRIMHLHAVPRVYVWRRARINTAKITNAPDGIIEGDQPAGTAIQWLVPTSVPAEYLQRIDKIISWAEKETGLSELSISAKQPQGIQHAPAMQHLAEEQSIRHMPAYRALEQFFVESARVVVDLLRLLAQQSKDYKVIWGDDDDLRAIAWDDVDLDADKYRLTVWPTNLFAQTPTAKIEQVLTLVERGVVDPKMGWQFIVDGFADARALLADSNASRDNIDRKLDSMVTGDGSPEEWIAEPYLDLAMAEKRTVDRLNRAEADGIEPEALDRLRQFYEDLQALKQKALVQAAMAQAVQQGEGLQTVMQAGAPGGARPGGPPPGRPPAPPPGPPGGPPAGPPGPPAAAPMGGA